MSQQIQCPIFRKTTDELFALEKETCLYAHPYKAPPCEDQCGLPVSTRLYFRTAMRAANAAEYSRYENNFKRGQRIFEAASKGGRGKKESLEIQKKHLEYKKMATKIKIKHPRWSKRDIARQIVKLLPINENAFRKDKTASPEYIRKLI